MGCKDLKKKKKGEVKKDCKGFCMLLEKCIEYE